MIIRTNRFLEISSTVIFKETSADRGAFKETSREGKPLDG
jgi:hypothetical protein